MKLVFTSILLTLFSLGYTQSSKIQYESERTAINQELYPDALIFNRVTKQVYFKHEGIKVWCDKAIYYQEENFFKAFGNVKMVQGDTLNLKSTYAEYNGNTQFAFASDNVVLKTPNNSLSTDSLFFNRIVQKAFYRSGGTVRDTASTITSVKGTYELEIDKYAFRQNVKVISPDYKINTEILDFYTNNGHAYLYGPSTIKTSNGKVYCERGFYDTRENFGHFVKNSRVDYEARKLYGDSIYFDQNKNFASASNNIQIIDSTNRTRIKGHYAEVFKNQDSLIISKNPIASTFQENDSIHIASNIMLITGQPNKRVVKAYPDARIFKSDLSGKADSIYSSQKSGYTKLLKNPVLWSENGQISGDTIILISDTKTEQLDSLKIYYNSVLVQKDTIDGFNQMKGKELFGLFKQNKLTEVNFIKNAESIYYPRTDDGQLIGIEKKTASSIKIFFKENDISDIYYYEQVPGELFPEKDISPNARILKGMNWRGEEQIKSKADLLTNRPKYTLPKIKGIKAIEEMDTTSKKFYKQEDLNSNSSLKIIDSIQKLKKK